MKFSNLFRKPKTKQEKTANQEEWHRTKRRADNLPSTWDDIFHETQKSWKKHRKTKYKPK